MKMRKLLAVVLAVTMAISAMALSVFADTYEIQMYNYTSTDTYTVSYTYTVPAYALYGYASQSDSLVLNLPSSYSVVTTDTTTTSEVTGYTVTYTDEDGVEHVDTYEYDDYHAADYPAGNDYDETYTLVEDAESGEAFYSTDETATTFDAETCITVDTYESGAYDAGNTIEDEVVALGGSVKEVETETETSVTVPVYVLPVSYKLEVNGVEVDLKGSDGTTVEAYEQVVEIGTFARDYYYNSNNGTEINAMVPQSTMVQESTPITITATVDYSSLVDTYYYDGGSSWTVNTWDVNATYYYWYAGWPTNNAYGVYITYKDDKGVDVGTVYLANMNLSKTYGGSSTQDAVIIIADTTADTTVSAAASANALLYWDHTLANRGTMLQAATTEGATAKLIVSLEDSIYGYAIYTLTATAEAYDNNTYYNSDYWYGSASTGLYSSVVDTYALSGNSTDTLEFDVDPSLLYNNTYGLYNGNMYITQAITASNSSLGSTKYYTYTDYGSTYQLRATDVTLVVEIPSDDADITVDEPIEPGDTDSEDDGDDDITVNEPVETEPAETNPTTGIVLALVPMAVAAAAAVASKRR